VVNGHKSAAHTDSPDGGSGRTCLGGGMRCPSASSFYSARNCIASAVLATAIPSVCPPVRPSHAGICVKTTARSTVQFAPLHSKMCLVL